MVLEPEVEPIFHPDSYGYRPGRSALDAVGKARERCWKFDWVIDLDIRSFFDSIPWDLIEKAVAHHTESSWVRLYVKRWLQAPVEREDGTLVERTRGTPQGSSVSPLLANLVLHYAFDLWMQRTLPHLCFERYADDAIVHCRTKARLEPLWWRSENVLRNAVWNSTRRKPGSSTARIINGERNANTSRSTSLATPSSRAALAIERARSSSTPSRQSATRLPEESDRPFVHGDWVRRETTGVLKNSPSGLILSCKDG
ncbi:retron-type reverse transcriptase [Bradyrhizobium ottawaense]|uniref:reverse transcriptase domain-containing protein n=1 Tax=Bradyrhizobium ottawaense TaxID=931866 RepID=UPI0038392479